MTDLTASWPTISIIVSTFGEHGWRHRALRALESARNQTTPALEVIYNHGHDLQHARNLGAEQATGDWLVFLDADDELDQYFVERMRESILQHSLRSDRKHWLIRPATIGVRPDGVRDFAPVVLEEKPLLEGNFMIIATAVERELFHQVGGFGPMPIYEDWDLWIRCWRAGAGFGTASGAVYVVHVSEVSRNNQDRDIQVHWYNQIRSQYQ